MKILNKYIIREYFRIFGLAMVIFQAIYIIIDLFGKTDEIVAHNVPFSVVLKFIVAKIPLIISQVSPIAILLSTVFLLSILAKNHELTSIRSSGISFLQVITPILLIAVCITLLSYLLSEAVLPWTNQMVKQGKRLIQGKEPLERLHKNRIWLCGGKDMFINIKHIDPEKKKMFGVGVYFVDENFFVRKRVNAKSVEWIDGKWVFQDGLTRYFEGTGKVRIESFEEKTVVLNRDFDDFLYVKKTAAEMNYLDLKNYIRTLKENGYKSDKYLVDLYGKFSIPFANFIMALIAIPFAVKSPRSGSYSGVALCIIIGFAYWTFLSFGLSLGHKEAISPVIGAWMGNVVFGIIAFFLLRSKRVHFF